MTALLLDETPKRHFFINFPEDPVETVVERINNINVPFFSATELNQLKRCIEHRFTTEQDPRWMQIQKYLDSKTTLEQAKETIQRLRHSKGLTVSYLTRLSPEVALHALASTPENINDLLPLLIKMIDSPTLILKIAESDKSLLKACSQVLLDDFFSVTNQNFLFVHKVSTHLLDIGDFNDDCITKYESKLTQLIKECNCLPEIRETLLKLSGNTIMSGQYLTKVRDFIFCLYILDLDLVMRKEILREIGQFFKTLDRQDQVTLLPIFLGFYDIDNEIVVQDQRIFWNDVHEGVDLLRMYTDQLTEIGDHVVRSVRNVKVFNHPFPELEKVISEVNMKFQKFHWEV